MKNLFLSLLASTLFLACSSNQEKTSKTDQTVELSVKEKKKAICMKLVYPVSYMNSDSSTFVINSDSDSAWYSVKDTSKTKTNRPVLVYPVKVYFSESDVTKTINNAEEMAKAKAYCSGEKKKNCFTLVYPVEMKSQDTTFTMEKDDWSAIKDYYKAHPEIEDKPTMVYPVSVQFPDGSTKEVNTEDEMIVLKKGC